MFLRILKNILKNTLIASAFLSVIVIYFIYTTQNAYSQDLSSPEVIMSSNDTGLILLDKSGTPFFTFDGARIKKPIPLSQVPIHTQHAVIATEDKDFYTHSGISAKAIIRSLIKDIESRKLIYGGSTITQQLIKNTLLNSNKIFLRKFQEAILAYEMEKIYNKEQILEMYLNSVYFGDGAFGIEEAALVYFGKHASELSLAESSLLAGLLPSPSKYSPLTGNIEESKFRQRLVLNDMLEQKFITPEEKTQAENAELVFKTVRDPINNTGIHFAFMARDELIAKYGEEKVKTEGFKVQTTLDLEWQKYAEEVVENQVKRLAGNRVTNGAAVVLDPKNGEIRALVGSRNWFEENFGKVNVVTSLRQPGSSFKPIYYSAALDKHIITPSTILKDQPVNYGSRLGGAVPYQPKNYDGKFRGLVTTRRSLANSLNVPSVEVLSKIGIDTGLEMAEKLGITTLNRTEGYGLSLALGSGEVKLLELTNAYATFANQGRRNKTTTILQIQDKLGNTIYRHEPDSRKVIGADVSFLIYSILSDDKTRSEIFGNTLNISRPAAVKTGTSESYKDSWTVGFVPTLAIGSWVGNNDGRLMDNVAGSLGAAPIWKSLMEKFLQGDPIQKLEPPENIVVCKVGGLGSKDGTASSTLEYYIKGTEPGSGCSTNTSPTPTPKATLTPTSSPTSPPGTIKPSPAAQANQTPTPTSTPGPTSVPTPTPTSRPTLTPKPSPSPTPIQPTSTPIQPSPTKLP